jgi:hypothetical protein
LFWQALQGRLLKSSSLGVPFILKVIDWLFYFCKPYTGDFPLHTLRMPRTRDLAWIDYAHLSLAAFLIRSFQPSCFSFCHFSFFLPFVQLLSLTAMHSIPLRAVHSLLIDYFIFANPTRETFLCTL